MKVAFVGSRGIPTKYGGAESFVEETSERLVKLGFEVYVTCGSNRFYKDEYNGIIRIHAPYIQGKIITVPSMNAVLPTLYLLLRCPNIKLVYYTGAGSSLGAVIPRLLGKKIIVNTDGIEWKRPLIRRKYFSTGWKLISIFGCWYIKLTEWLGVKLSHVVIADSRAIKAYLEQRYKAKNVVYIPYGARQLLNSNIPFEKERRILGEFGLSTGEYYLTVGRIVAENGIHKQIEGFRKSKSNKRIFIVGNFDEKDRYTRYLTKLRDGDSRVIFSDPIYDKEVLGILRKNCYGYIHAYEVGGTNPSLLEQMLFKKPIIAYDVPFHREVLEDGGIYFRDEDDLAKCIQMLENGEFDLKEIEECQIGRIEEEYNWDAVAQKYSLLFWELASATPVQSPGERVV